MVLRFLKSFREMKKALGRGVFDLCEKREKRFGVATGGSPRVAPEGGSDSARQIRGLLSKRKLPYN